MLDKSEMVSRYIQVDQWVSGGYHLLFIAINLNVIFVNESKNY